MLLIELEVGTVSTYFIKSVYTWLISWVGGSVGQATTSSLRATECPQPRLNPP